MKFFETYKCLLLVFSLLLLGCTEAYELKTENFESLLVVEASITDEFKTQEIKLSKTFRLESNEPNLVSNAQVSVATGSGFQYTFVQSEPGLYNSTEVFNAQAGETYTLNITLEDGTSYISTPEILPPASQLESLDASLETVNGQLGVQVYANSSIDVHDAIYFKYDYEETYKIVVPYYHPFDLTIINYDRFTGYYELELVLKPENVSTCYNSNISTDIIQTSLSDSQNSSVEQFPVRFIPSNNSKIRDRYSILVKQSVQSLEAYNFYRILKELGTIENLFTDNQPGFIQGNMTSLENIEENVIGFFQVSSVSSKRIYFNYADFEIPKPPYLLDCVIYEDLDYEDASGLDGDRNDNLLLYTSLRIGSFTYVRGYHPIYTIVSAQCGNCTLFSSTVIPEFWEE